MPPPPPPPPPPPHPPYHSPYRVPYRTNECAAGRAGALERGALVWKQRSDSHAVSPGRRGAGGARRLQVPRRALGERVSGSNLLTRHHTVSLLLLDAALAVRAVKSLASLGAARTAA